MNNCPTALAAGGMVRPAAMALLACLALNPAPALASVGEGTEGFVGWWHMGPTWFAPTGNAENPGDACRLTAHGHMGTNLRNMYPKATKTPFYACVYRHFGWQNMFHDYGTTFLQCAQGYKPVWPGTCVKRVEKPRPPGRLPGEAAFACSNPIIVSTGAKVQTETDVSASSGTGLIVQRTYRTQRQTGVGQSAGVAWSFSFDRDFSTNGTATGKLPLSVTVTAGDGSASDFERKSDGTFKSYSDNKESLQALTTRYDEWVHTTADGAVDFYKLVGTKFLLISTRTVSGAAHHYIYDADHRLKRIVDGHDRTIDISWSGIQVVAVQGPEGGVRYQYGYDERSEDDSLATMAKLDQVTFVNATGTAVATKRYHYEDPRNQYLLTGITDENGARYANYAYNGSGQAILSEHAGGANRHVFDYSIDNATVITDPLGTERKFTFTTPPGELPARVIGESQQGGAGCSASASTRQYDSTGTTMLKQWGWDELQK